GVDDVLGDVVTAEVARPGERDVHGDVVGEFGGAAFELDEHTVDAATTLDVLIGTDDVAIGGLDASDVAETDVLLERHLELFELGLTLTEGIDALRRDELGQGVGLGLELIGTGDEVGL